MDSNRKIIIFDWDDTLWASTDELRKRSIYIPSFLRVFPQEIPVVVYEENAEYMPLPAFTENEDTQSEEREESSELFEAPRGEESSEPFEAPRGGEAELFPLPPFSPPPPPLSTFDITTHYNWEKYKSTVLDLFIALKYMGIPIYIISNARQSWIDECLEKFGSDASLIREYATIISAQDLYARYTTDINLWKYLCFKDIVRMHGVTELISIGDGVPEFVACRQLEASDNVICKHVVISWASTLDEIIYQLKNISEKIHWLFTINKDKHDYISPMRYFAYHATYGLMHYGFEQHEKE